jgi:hypothetical protein
MCEDVCGILLEGAAFDEDEYFVVLVIPRASFCALLFAARGASSQGFLYPSVLLGLASPDLTVGSVHDLRDAIVYPISYVNESRVS